MDIYTSLAFTFFSNLHYENFKLTAKVKESLVFLNKNVYCVPNKQGKMTALYMPKKL